MNNVSSDEEEEDEINICADLKFEVLPDASDQLTNGLKKVDLSSAPPLQIAEYINSIKTKQENFELKLAQGNVNFQHILETLEDNELRKILEVLKSRKGTSENKNVFVAELVLEDLGGINASIAHLKNTKVELMDFFVKQYAVAYGTSRGESAEFSNEKCESAVKQVKEYRCGLRQMMAEGDSSVARSSESRGRNVMWNITWLLICKSRLKGCYIKIAWTQNIVNREHKTLRTVNMKHCEPWRENSAICS